MMRAFLTLLLMGLGLVVLGIEGFTGFPMSSATVLLALLIALVTISFIASLIRSKPTKMP